MPALVISISIFSNLSKAPGDEDAKHLPVLDHDPLGPIGIGRDLNERPLLLLCQLLALQEILLEELLHWVHGGWRV